jgi:hypothetical protein
MKCHCVYLTLLAIMLSSCQILQTKQPTSNLPTSSNPNLQTTRNFIPGPPTPTISHIFTQIQDDLDTPFIPTKTTTFTPPPPTPTPGPTTPPAGTFAIKFYPPLVLDYPTDQWIDKSEYDNTQMMINFLQNSELMTCTINPMGPSGFYPDNMQEINLGGIRYQILLNQHLTNGTVANYYFAFITYKGIGEHLPGLPHFAVQSSPTEADKCRTTAEEVLATLHSPDLTTSTPAIPSLSAYPPEIHETLSSGLTIDEYALVSAPSTEPLTYSAYKWTAGEMHIKHNPYRWDTFPDISSWGTTGLYLSTMYQGQKLVAKEYYTSTATTLAAFGDVNVYLGDKLIDKIPIGNGSPVEALRGLWTYDQDWAVETAYVISTYHPDTNVETFTVIGQVVINGEMLNNRDHLDETFGFQTMHGRPFYFYKQDGKINISYDDLPVIVGYDTIPHYGCCSAGILNPNPAKNMVSFFAQKNGIWYYVEVGVFN